MNPPMPVTAPDVSAKPGRKAPECHLPVRKAQWADAHAPVVVLPLRFMLAGLVALLAGAGCLIARPDVLSTYHYNQYSIAVTHLFVLGFVCTIVMGAMYQLAPVALGTQLHSVRLARRQFLAHVIGVAGMVAMFWIWNMKQVGHFGSVLALGVGWFVYNMFRTLRTVPRWDVVAWGMAASLVWLSLTVLAGLYLASAKCWSFSPFDALAAMHAHAHAGVAGIFVGLLLTVSLKLVPMFVLGAIQNQHRAAWSLGLVNAGLVGVATSVLLQSRAKFVFGLVMVAGLALYGWEMRAILRARKRQTLDWGLRAFLTGLVLLGPVSLLGLVLAWPGLAVTELTSRLETVYGFLALLGVVGLAILGMLCKIVPFLVWYHSYSRHVGRARVPSLGDLMSGRLMGAGYALFLIGVLALSAGILTGSEEWVRGAAVVLLAGVACYMANFAGILSHWWRPRLAPLAPAAA